LAVAAQFYVVNTIRSMPSVSCHADVSRGSVQRGRCRVDHRREANMRAEEGDESIDELADEAAKTKKELRESTETGEKVQSQEGRDGKQY
jgi:hypothetical protein